MNLLCQNTPRHDNLPTLAAFGGHELSDRLRRGHRPVRMTVMPYPDWLLISETEIHAANGALSPTLEFTQPLVRDVEVTGDRNGKDPGGPAARRLAEPSDSVAKDESHS